MRNDHAPKPVTVLDKDGRVVEVVDAEEFRRRRPLVLMPLKMTQAEREGRAKRAAAARWGKRQNGDG